MDYFYIGIAIAAVLYGIYRLANRSSSKRYGGRSAPRDDNPEK